jgi:hypothetical protein
MFGGVDVPDVRQPGTSRRRDDESDGDDSDDSTRPKPTQFSIRSKNGQKARKPADDSGSDLDL